MEKDSGDVGAGGECAVAPSRRVNASGSDGDSTTAEAEGLAAEYWLTEVSRLEVGDWDPCCAKEKIERIEPLLCRDVPIIDCRSFQSPWVNSIRTQRAVD